ncbi:MAG: 30S ribosomal protein S3, partial [Candidatus Pacebacteria bacterium]|nr:30S ribosomal protein S3 [Candidatus Paceibacterota bacterium]
MGNKVNPIGLRIGITQSWRSKWFSKKEYKLNLRQDIEIRNSIMKKWKAALISDVEIERSAKMIKVIIKTARPGVLIGRGGSGIEDVKNYIHREFFHRNKNINLRLDVQEVKHFEESAMIVAQNIV